MVRTRNYPSSTATVNLQAPTGSVHTERRPTIPQKWVRCPWHEQPERDDKGRVLIEDCLKCSQTRLERDCDWTYPILRHMVQHERDYISPTALASTRCLRQTVLSNAVDYAVDLEKRWAAVRGTLAHAGLEQHPEGLTEVKLQRSIEIDGVTYVIRGTADNIVEAQSLVRDWKTVADLAKKLKYGDLPAADHVEQVSMYGWMAAGNEWVRYDAAGLALGVEEWDLHYGEIVYMDPKHVRRDTFDLWPHQMVEDMLRIRIPIARRAMEQGQKILEWRVTQEGKLAPEELMADMPPVRPAEEQGLCAYCDVFDTCVALAKREGVEPPRLNRRPKRKAA